MSAELYNKLLFARQVFEKKAVLDEQIAVERGKIKAIEYRMAQFMARMDDKRVNRNDRGLILGRRFAVVGGLMFIFMIIAIVCSIDAYGVSEDLGGILALIGVIGMPAVIASILLLSAYKRGKKKRAADVAPAKREYEFYLHNTANPEMEKRRRSILRMEAQAKDLIDKNARNLSFLPVEYWNIDAVNYIINYVKKTKDMKLEHALKLCRAMRINQRYVEMLDELETKVSGVPRQRTGGSDVGFWIGEAVMNGIFDGIF